jgi:hypothetical protein
MPVRAGRLAARGAAPHPNLLPACGEKGRRDPTQLLGGGWRRRGRSQRLRPLSRIARFRPLSQDAHQFADALGGLETGAGQDDDRRFLRPDHASLNEAA